VTKPSPLFEGVWEKGQRYPVWMSHGDRVTGCPRASRSRHLGERADRHHRRREAQVLRRAVPSRGDAHAARRALLRNFVRKIAGCTGDWTMRAFREEAIEKIRKQVGKGRVICGLSGGVDSAVAAVLIHEAIGDQLTCVFVDHGLLRSARREGRRAVPRPLQHPARACGCVGDLFLGALEASDPEEKRKIIGRLFIDVFERKPRNRRRRFPGAGHALSRRDRERVLHRRSVGDDQVAPQCRRPARAHEHEARRAAARTVQGRGARARPRTRPARVFVGRHPFPGPGLAIRCPGAASRARSSTSCATPTKSISRKSAAPASTTKSGRPSP
jgi:GMP synthase (glutamine-hydrolysing)